MYFKSFPTIKYPIQDTLVVLQDITRRVRILKKLDESGYTDQYLIQDGEFPDTLSFRFYGDATMYWILMLANNKMSLTEDWPISAESVQAKTIKELGSLDAALSVRHYVDSRKLIVPSSFPGVKFPVTYLEHATNQNDAKRPLKVPPSRAAFQIAAEFEREISK